MTPPDHIRLYLVRHGEVAANREMRYIGSNDDPLTDLGVVQAGAVASVFGSLTVAAVLSSPLLRARQTAAAVAGECRLEVRVDDRLREQSYGDWEGLTRASVHAADAERLRRWERDANVSPPGGDSLVTVRDRIVALAEELREADLGPTVLVSHVSPIKALLCSVLGVRLEDAHRMFLDPATISVVDWGPRPILRLFNGHAHLGWPSARWLAG